MSFQGLEPKSLRKTEPNLPCPAMPCRSNVPHPALRCVCACVCPCACVFFGFASEAEGSGCDSNVPMVIIVASLVRFGSVLFRFVFTYHTVQYGTVPRSDEFGLRLAWLRSVWPGSARNNGCTYTIALHPTGSAPLCCVVLCFVLSCSFLLWQPPACLLTHSLTDLLTPAASG